MPTSLTRRVALLRRALARATLTPSEWGQLLANRAFRSERLMPAIVKALRGQSAQVARHVGRRPHRLVIVGGGVLGSVLALHAQKRGYPALVVTRTFGSTAFEFGEGFRLNTWNRRGDDEWPPGISCDQHPGLVVPLWRFTSARFPDGGALRDAALVSLWASGVSVLLADVARVDADAELATLRLSRSRRVAARNVVICTGFGTPAVELQDPASAQLVRHALSERSPSRIMGFQQAVQRAVHGQPLARGHVLLVGSGPSALGVLELLFRESSTVPVVWVTGRAGPKTPADLGQTPVRGAREMYEVRYQPLRVEAERRVRAGSLEIVNEQVAQVASTSSGVELRVGQRALVGERMFWCGGHQPGLGLVGASSAPVVDATGETLGVQRDGGRVFGVGPTLDARGYGHWPTGPLSEWARKAMRLVDQVMTSASE